MEQGITELWAKGRKTVTILDKLARSGDNGEKSRRGRGKDDLFREV